MSDYAKDLENAAKLTQRIVEGLTWLERQGPTKGRLECISEDIKRLSKEFQVALIPGKDSVTEQKYGKEIDRLRSLLGTIGLLRRHLSEASEHLFLRIHVLDALEKIEK